MSVPSGNIDFQLLGGTVERYNPLHVVHDHRFRLPGFDGAALLLRSITIPINRPMASEAVMAFDVGFLSPDRKVEYLARTAKAGFVKELAECFWRMAQDVHPEQSVPNFEDPKMGLTVAAVSSTDLNVEVQLTLVEEFGANVLEFDILNFKTSRLALIGAANDLSIFREDWDTPTWGGDDV